VLLAYRRPTVRAQSLQPSCVKRHVLLLAAAYGHQNSVRARAIARCLSDSGHSVTVICADAPNHVHPGAQEVQVLRTRWPDLVDLGKRLGLRRTSLGRPRLREGQAQPSLLRRLEARLVVPDSYVSWIPGALRAARQVLRPDTVLVSTAPLSGHIVSRRIEGHGWIADINDLWWKNPHRTAGVVRSHIDQALEHYCLDAASIITTVNDVMADELRRRYSQPVRAIMSGFDPHDFPVTGPPPDNNPRELLFAGHYYPGFDLGPLFRAVGEARQEGWLHPSDLVVRFVGGASDAAELVAERSGVTEYCSFEPPVERQQLLRRLSGADALLLPLYDNDPYSLPSRLFEYVGARRPIVAVGPADRLPARIVSEHRLGCVASTVAEVKAVLRDLVGERSLLRDPPVDAWRDFTWGHNFEAFSATVAAL